MRLVRGLQVSACGARQPQEQRKNGAVNRLLELCDFL
jgi:hypothetical protein